VRRGGVDDEDLIFEDEIQRNILYEPLSPAVQRQVLKAGIRVSVFVHNNMFSPMYFNICNSILNAGDARRVDRTGRRYNRA
jgi:hypothetical protein